jgi:chromate transporter
MIKKMHKKKLPRAIMACSCIAMFCINLFAWDFSSISLMLIAAIVSLTIFVLNGAPEQKGGAKK